MLEEVTESFAMWSKKGKESDELVVSSPLGKIISRGHSDPGSKSWIKSSQKNRFLMIYLTDALQIYDTVASQYLELPPSLLKDAEFSNPNSLECSPDERFLVIYQSSSGRVLLFNTEKNHHIEVARSGMQQNLTGPRFCSFDHQSKYLCYLESGSSQQLYLFDLQTSQIITRTSVGYSDIF